MEKAVDMMKILNMEDHRPKLEKVIPIQKVKDLVLVDLTQVMNHQEVEEVGMVVVLLMSHSVQQVDQEDQGTFIIHQQHQIILQVVN